MKLKNELQTVEQAAGGDKAALETILSSVQDMVFNLSLRMLGLVPDAENRAIYILGTMFRLDSRIAAEILDLSPEAYRQRLSRIRKKVGAFLAQYCGLSGTGICSCKRRVDYAVMTQRLNPAHLAFQEMETGGYEELTACTDAMEQLDNLSQVFAGMPAYRSPETVTAQIREMMASRSFQAVLHGQGEME